MNEKRLLLHICCAPDATVSWLSLIGEGYETVGYFYGGNLHPREEYDKREAAVLALAGHIGAELFLADYSPKPWFEAIRGLEKEAERGKRCRKCFEIQLAAAAEWGAHNSFTHLCTTLTISPHKDAALVNEIGACAAASHGLAWVERIWRKGGGFKRSVDISNSLGLYRQNYCGCIFSKNIGL